jgi:hypothetical protein
VNILECMADESLFAPFFRGKSWDAWKVFLAALFGLPMNANQLVTFRERTQRNTPPTEQVAEAWLVCGRRSGKTRISGLVAVYLACFVDYSPFLAAGERASIVLLASDKRQAALLKSYVEGFLESVPILSRMVVNRTQEDIELSNRVSISIHTSNYRSIRGYTVAACLCDEIGFWMDDNSANPASEILAAVRPAMSTIPSALLLAFSSPYARRGPLFENYRDHFGKDDSPVLVWQAPTREMNPLVSRLTVARAFLKDAASARSEWDAMFRDDLESLFSLEVIERLVASGRHELPPVAGVHYVAFVDPSGGQSDSMVLSIAHEEKGCAIVDCVREIVAPFSPDAAVKEFAAILKSYRVGEVEGDRYAANWCSEQFEKAGVIYRASELNRSQIYLEFLAVAMSGQCVLLENKKALNQFIALERRTGRNQDVVDHPRGAHDDLSNVIAGVVVRVLHGQVGELGLLGYFKSVFSGEIALPSPPPPPSPRSDNSPRMKRFELGLTEKFLGQTPPCPQCSATITIKIGGGGIRCNSCGHQFDVVPGEFPPSRADLLSGKWKIKVRGF